MATIIEQPGNETVPSFEHAGAAVPMRDVPGMMASRVGSLYAEEERRARLARTEEMIQRASAEPQ
jgi:hypothetical protein